MDAANPAPTQEPATPPDAPAVEPQPICGSADASSTPETTPPAAAGDKPGVESSPEPQNILISELRAFRTAWDANTIEDKFLQKLVDKLHAEALASREGLVEKSMRPLLLDLVRMHEDIHRLLDVYRAKSAAEISAEKLLQNYASFAGDLEESLARQGVDIFENPPDKFDPVRQKALKRVPTEDPALHRKIAQRVRKGFVLGGAVLRPELVTVYDYTPPPA